MNLNEYQILAMRTCSIPYADTGAMLNHAIFGLTSEAGEVSGILQKVYQGYDADPEHLKKELGDCLWMIAEACTALGFDLDDVAKTNIEKLGKRYPNGFDAEHSLQRNGMIGHSEIVGFDCDGDGDFRPIFSSNYAPNHLHEVYITECPQITMINGVDI